MVEQSKLESKIESSVNIASGFLISLAVWALIIRPLIRYGYLTIDDKVIIVSIFTVTSWLRSYFWRRFFARGFHKVIHKFLKKWVRLN